MERYVLLLGWGAAAGGAEHGAGTEAAVTVANIYKLLKEKCNSSIKADTMTFPACSVAGVPGIKKWYFASHVICGYYQFCSSDWEEINSDMQKNEDSLQTTIEKCLGNIQNFEEDDNNSRESLSMADVYDEAAESLHQLADRLPAPGRAMVDIILQAVEGDAPKLKDCLPVIGALKHLREWHSAQITIATSDSKGWQKIADYLSADFVSSDNVLDVINLKELWRGKIQIWERKFASEVSFPEFCMKSTSAKPLSTSHVNSCFAVKEEQRCVNSDALPEVFHYYGPALEFLRMAVLSELPPFFISDLEFELSLARKGRKEMSALLLDQISSLSGKVGALVSLTCNVSSIAIPSPAQLSTKKWKEYMARKPKVITVPEIDLKGESCRYYFLLQGNGSGGCKATLIHSATQINGMATLAAVNRMLKTNAGETESSFPIDDFIESLPRFCGKQIVQRERKLSHLQASALKEYLKRKKLTEQPPVISTGELKSLLELTRECFLDLWRTNLPESVLQKAANKTSSHTVASESDLMEPNPLEWPERHVLQNLENFEKIKQKMRASMLAHSSEQLLGHKDSQRESLTSLDAKELLKYFTPEGLPVGDLQPLHIPKRYCLDNRKALERDLGYAELQARLIRYETQTTCTKECCPLPVVLSPLPAVLSPLPSPAVLSEPGSVPDGESLQSEFRTEVLRLKRRSKDLDCFCPRKRLMKSESTDSLLSQASGGNGSHNAVVVTRKRSERSVSLTSMVLKQSGQPHKAATRSGSASCVSATESETSKPVKESRSQKHTRMLKEVVAKTLQKHGIAEDHKCFASCSQRLFEISKFYLKDLKTSRGLLDEMKKTASNNAKQVIEWVLEKTGK
ncbi:mdm2-binding protein isoform X4 [Gallus gallus]|uniref:mdm2-binding protein isoform X4 n=1 Tax=Gallus gallus TaxID=9031 RepID=UPI001AE82289|nr:mdm2-binding protein isoform X4 [Gallus gallus]